MKVADVRARAKVWVANEATDFPGFKGAYIVGSVNHRGDDEEHPATSDVDVKVVLDADPLPGNPGKFLYRGALLDVGFVPFKDLRNAEDVLGHYHLAAGLCTPSVIADPTGSLTELQRAVTAEYAREQWVERRCRHARDSVLRWIGGIQRAELYHDQVTCWLFAAGAMAHVVLVAGLQNPTIRRRYQAVQQVLARYGYLDFHETLLTLMGCATLTRAQVEQHLDAGEEVFDVASRLIETPYRFAADISALGRPIAIDGSRELIEAGFHREAMFWLGTTYSRCQAILTNDASPEIRETHARGYADLLDALGVAGVSDLESAGQRIREALPRLDEIAEAVIAGNPEIKV